MLVVGFPSGALAANCYLIAASTGAEAIIVDPGQDAAARVSALAAQHELRPVAVLLTHGHLDHVAAARAVCGAELPCYLHPDDDWMLDDPLAALTPQLRDVVEQLLGPDDDVTRLRPERVRPLDSDGPLRVAGLPVTVLATPGHTPGSVTFRLDRDDGAELLLTGDTLFAGSVGRTDLPGGSAPSLLASIRDRLLTRPDDAVVLPGHGPGTTIGAERSGNPFLA